MKISSRSSASNPIKARAQRDFCAASPRTNISASAAVKKSRRRSSSAILKSCVFDICVTNRRSVSPQISSPAASRYAFASANEYGTSPHTLIFSSAFSAASAHFAPCKSPLSP